MTTTLVIVVGVGWHPGDRLLDLYDVLDVVHSGGMGLVYRVRHLTWQFDLAIKTPRPELVATHTGRERFEDEAGTWVGLGVHPHVVGCAYVRRIGDLPCVFAEWVDGGSLATAVRQGDLCTEDPQESLARVLDIAIQTAWGIGHAHDQGVVHQDVKPANVMLDGGIAKITDFGLAKARAAAGEQLHGHDVLASYGGMTPAYCSPEQAAAAAGASVRLTKATDVWSWAVSVLEMFVGRPPCRYGQTAPIVLEQVLADGQVDLPRGVADLLRQCFQEDPRARPAVDDLAEALAASYAEVAGTGYPRVRPEAANLLADSLSNQALSLVDLGRGAEAEALWQEAMNVAPHYPSAVYNWGLYRWRIGRMTDSELVSELERVRELKEGDQSAEHLLGLIELERGHDEAAERLLRDAPGTPDFDAARVVLAERAEVPPPAVFSASKGRTTCLTISEDGSVALLGTEKGHVLVWSPTDLVVLRELSGKEAVTGVAISADGGRCLVVYADGAVDLWDVATGANLGGFPSGDVTAVALDRTGRTGTTVHRSGAVYVWDFDTGTRRNEFTTDPPAAAVALDDAGTRVVAVCGESGDYRLLTWDLPTGRRGPGITRTRPDYLTGIDQVALSADGRHALLYYRRGPLKVWDARTGEMQSDVQNHITAYSQIALSRDGKVAVSVGELSNEPLRVWDTAFGRCVRSIDVKLDEISLRFDSVALSGDARIALALESFSRVQVHRLPGQGYLAPWNYARPTGAGELDEHARRFNELLTHTAALLQEERPSQAAAVLREAREVPGFDSHPDLRMLWAEVGRHGVRTDPLAVWYRWGLSGTWIFTPQLSLGVSSDGEVAITGGADGRTRAWELATGECLGTFNDRTPGHVHTIGMSRDDRYIVTVDYGGGAFLWDLAEGRTEGMFGDQSHARSLATNGERVVIGHESGAVCVWDIGQGAVHLRTILAHDQPAEAVAVSADGKLVVSRNSGEQRIRVWDAATGRPRFELSSSIWPGLLRFEHELLFATELDGLYAWDMKTGGLAYQLAERGGTDVFALSADGSTGATAGMVDEMLIWDTGTGQIKHRLPVRAKAAALTADGRYAALADGLSVQLWDLRTGRRAHVLEGHLVDVTSVRFAADDHLLLSADLTPLLRLWELDWDYEL
ncbi:protein kinase [Kibdelosporangium philippinense]|uniref:Protein kinase n=1 Tax=Kibdelosporangium philippinense TaxID=211113 RepID=A0ABS8ZAC8_9PSEU|nr:protein kinase [Kibdelosporangium philippinense]MCE7003760.1 protein kinase [Kibdelosporangium philippinense]